MKSGNLCLAAVVTAFSLSALAAEPVDQPEPFYPQVGEVQPDAAAGGSVSDEAVGFQALDENEDGVISRDEAQGTYLEKQFDALHANHDGQLSPSEVAAGSPAAAGAGATAAPK